MEELDYRRNRHAVRFMLVMLGLAMIAGGLIVVLAFALSSMAGVSGRVLHLLAQVAWVSLALLLVVLIVLIWTVMRYIRRQLLSDNVPPASEHPDAWEVAGRRLKLDDAARGSSGHWRAEGPDPGEDD